MLKVVLAHVSACNAFKFFSRIFRNEALVYKSFFFFRRAVFRKLFDTIRFSYKQCNFSRVCLLVYPVYQRIFLACDGELRFGRRHERRYRGSLFKTWPKPETAHENPLAPRVLLAKMDSKTATGSIDGGFAVRKDIPGLFRDFCF